MSLQHKPSNGAHHHYSDAIVDKLAALGLIQDADRGNHAAIEKALDGLLTKFASVPSGRPQHTFFTTPANQVEALICLLLADFEFRVGLGELPSQSWQPFSCGHAVSPGQDMPPRVRINISRFWRNRSRGG
jgi:hypothetical protein